MECKRQGIDCPTCRIWCCGACWAVTSRRWRHKAPERRRIKTSVAVSLRHSLVCTRHGSSALHMRQYSTVVWPSVRLHNLRQEFASSHTTRFFASNYLSSIGFADVSGRVTPSSLTSTLRGAACRRGPSPRLASPTFATSFVHASRVL
jgi:hypothetical protein